MRSSITFGELLAKHRKRLGRRVSLEEIFLLHDAADGTEAPSEVERIELLDRVAADPEAAQQLKSLIRFPEDSPRADDEGVGERWEAFRTRFLSAGEDNVDEKLPPPYQFAGRFGWQQVVGLAAALLLCVSLAFWAGRSVSISGASHDAGVQLNTYVVEISTSTQRSRGGMQVGWPSAAEGMLLAISAPEIESQGPLDLVILDTGGDTIVERSGLEPDSAGLFFVTVSRELLPPGDYEIQLRNDVEEILSSFDLEIYANQ